MASAREECLLGVHFQVLGEEEEEEAPVAPGEKAAFYCTLLSQKITLQRG